MSRYTRWVRKQAKARALGQAPESHFSGSQTALVEETPPAIPPVDEKSEHAGSCHASTGSGIGQEVPASDRGTPSHRPVPARHPGVGQPTSGSAGAEAGPGDSGANQREGERDRDQRDRRQPLNDGWLWRGKIQAGDIAVVVGEEGSGKSQIVADWIARVTSGRPFPGQEETTVPASVATSPAPSPAHSTRGQSSQPQSSPARSLESLRAQVARGEARLREFDLEGFRFIKPNFATTQLILDMEAELGSAEAIFAEFRKGLRSLEMYSPDEVDGFMEEYRRLYDIARQLHAPDAPRAAA